LAELPFIENLKNMAFRNYNLGILLRVSLIVSVSVFLAFVLVVKDWFFTPIVAIIALLVVVYELLYHLHRQRRELNNFLINIRQGGYNTSYNEEGSTEGLFTTFNQITLSFQELAIKKEENYQFLKVITENLKAGLICYNSDGSITLLNPAGKEIIGKPYMTNIVELDNIQPALARSVSHLQPGESDLVKISLKQPVYDILVQKMLIIIDEEEITIILMQNIRDQIDSNELESWQKLIRVMRHEIMNSLTPIVSLSEAIYTLLRDEKKLFPIDNKLEDVLESMEAISFRSKALLQFVNAYKSFAETNELNKTKFDATEMVHRIDQLLSNELKSKNVVTTMPTKPVIMYGDEEQLEGVVLNLIKNALEAVAVDGKINVKLSNTSFNTIVVVDDGTGLSDGQVDQIFVPFYTTKIKGSGIGLSLARKVIQLHGGKIDAHNNSAGGLTVELSF